MEQHISNNSEEFIVVLDTSGSTLGEFANNVAPRWFKGLAKNTDLPATYSGYSFDTKATCVFAPTVVSTDEELCEKLDELRQDPAGFTSIVKSVLEAIVDCINKRKPGPDEKIAFCVYVLTDMIECSGSSDTTVVPPRDIPKAITDGLIKLGETNPVYNNVAVSISAVFYSDNDNVDTGDEVYAGAKGLPPIFRVIGSINGSMTPEQQEKKINETICAPRHHKSMSVRALKDYKYDSRASLCPKRVVGSVLALTEDPKFTLPALATGIKAILGRPPSKWLRQSLNSLWSSIPILRKATDEEKTRVKEIIARITGKPQTKSIVLHALRNGKKPAPTFDEFVKDNLPALVRAFLKYVRSEIFQREHDEHKCKVAADNAVLALMKSTQGEEGLTYYALVDKYYSRVMDMTGKTVEEWYSQTGTNSGSSKSSPSSPRKKSKNPPKTSPLSSPSSSVSVSRKRSRESSFQSNPKRRILSKEICVDTDTDSDDEFMAGVKPFDIENYASNELIEVETMKF